MEYHHEELQDSVISSPNSLVQLRSNRSDIDNILQINVLPCDALDLLANCKATVVDDSQESDVEYAEIQDMGLWHSTPLAHRHKSKISLTWVLKENLEAKLPEKVPNQDGPKIISLGSKLEKYPRHNQKFIENERRKCKSQVRERIVGRNEYYHNLRFKSACEEFVNGQDTWSDSSAGTEEYTRKKHRHRHRRKKRNPASKFGYDIRDLDSFLSEVCVATVSLSFVNCR